MHALVRLRFASLRLFPAVLGLLLVACAAHQTPAPASRPVHPVPGNAERVGVPNIGLALVIRKAQRTLAVYRNGVATQEYAVVIGRNGGAGPKRFEGDMRTPEGLYWVTDKHPHARWRYFIGISYPNEYDVAAYAQAIAAGGIPVVDGEFMGIGGAVGIHGSDHYAEQAAGMDWTLGCIALRSEDIGVIYDLVTPGTPVLILP